MINEIEVVLKTGKLEQYFSAFRENTIHAPIVSKNALSYEFHSLLTLLVHLWES